MQGLSIIWKKEGPGLHVDTCGPGEGYGATSQKREGWENAIARI
jgi:hypothetical protein